MSSKFGALLVGRAPLLRHVDSNTARHNAKDLNPALDCSTRYALWASGQARIVRYCVPGVGRNLRSIADKIKSREHINPVIMASDAALDGREDLLSLDDSVSLASSNEVRQRSLKQLWEGMETCWIGSCLSRLHLLPVLRAVNLLTTCPLSDSLCAQRSNRQPSRTFQIRKRRHITKPRSAAPI